jgi:hypothetical protein
MLGLAALLSFTSGGAGRAGKILWTLLPVMIVLTAASLHRMYKGIDARALKAVRNDELRQASLSRAWRNGFFAVLGCSRCLPSGWLERHRVWRGPDGGRHRHHRHRDRARQPALVRPLMTEHD